MNTQDNEKMAKKRFDLDERTLRFASKVRSFLRYLEPLPIISEDRKQLLRSSGSVGANYIEANESISRKDFLLRIRICKKEAAESLYWLKLIQLSSDEKSKDILNELKQEAKELSRIFGAILNKFQ